MSCVSQRAAELSGAISLKILADKDFYEFHLVNHLAKAQYL